MYKNCKNTVHIHKKSVNSGCPEGEELSAWGTLFSNTFVPFVPLNSVHWVCINYLTIKYFIEKFNVNFLIKELAIFDHVSELSNNKSSDCR